ncbi:MAG: methyltransferase domain-containing protein [Alphaproteobacteria bacterium]|nr:methyltransferase domain-containing protein [Alphaproteobacteria bacterium]
MVKRDQLTPEASETPPLGGVNAAPFYASSTGRMVRHLISRKLAPMLAEDGPHLASAALGYGWPYLKYFPNGEVCHFSGEGHDITPWPQDKKHRSRQALVDLAQLPLLDASLDLMVVAHGLETSPRPDDMMAECWRVLKGQGRLIVIVPHRASLWAATDTTPFGMGQPYSVNQIKKLLKHHDFEVGAIEQALAAPPSRSNFYPKYAPFVERLPNLFGGVLIVEARKMIYSMRGVKVKTSSPTRSGLVHIKAT